MSSILKALRKLEEEKAQGLEGSPDIARNILKIRPRRKSSPWMVAGLVTVLVFASSVAGYILAAKNVRISLLSPETSRVPVERPPEKVLPSAKPSVLPAIVPPVLPSSQSRDGGMKPEPLPSTPNKATAKADPLPPAPAVEKVVRKTAKARPSSLPPPTPVKRKKAADPLPSLTLTGIAFQEEGVGRLAVVNNLPVMEGSVIEGATVMEISSDRVRFDLSGRSFEVLLDDRAARK